MDITYRILGSDGKEYGPVTQPQLQSWITDGRILADTQISRSDDGPWRQASQFVELNWPTTAATTPPPNLASPATATMQPDIAGALQRQMSSGASWFYWIAGLSAVNTIVALTSSGGFFVVGLGFTLLLDAFVGPPVSTVLGLLVIGVFVLFGVFAHKLHLWAFIAGIVLYGLDALIFLVFFKDWLAIAFHVFALWGLFSGLKAALALRKLATTA